VEDRLDQLAVLGEVLEAVGRVRGDVDRSLVVRVRPAFVAVVLAEVVQRGCAVFAGDGEAGFAGVGGVGQRSFWSDVVGQVVPDVGDLLGFVDAALGEHGVEVEETGDLDGGVDLGPVALSPLAVVRVAPGSFAAVVPGGVGVGRGGVGWGGVVGAGFGVGAPGSEARTRTRFPPPAARQARGRIGAPSLRTAGDALITSLGEGRWVGSVGRSYSGGSGMSAAKRR
jgi:hypothetical protein